MTQYLKAHTLAASAARTDTATDNGGWFTVDHGWTKAMVILQSTAKATEVGDYLDVFIDVSPDGGTTAINAGQFTRMLGNGTDADIEAMVLGESATAGTSTFSLLADAGDHTVRPTVFGNSFRARWTIVDTGTDNASFTFSVKLYLQ